MHTEPPVAIVGAGVSGSACARALADRGVPSRVFDKGRGAGGRMSTRRHGADTFDHGCAYFVARSPAFTTMLAPLIERGTVARIDDVQVTTPGQDRPGRLNTTTPLHVGVPGNSALCRALLDGVDLVPGLKVDAVRRVHDRWVLSGPEGEDLGTYHAVVIAVPSSQVAAVVGKDFPNADRALDVDYSPCWSVMAAFDGPLETSLQLAIVDESEVGWVAREQARPGRPSGERWVVHATEPWSRKHIDFDADDVARVLHRSFVDLLASSQPLQPRLLKAHLWRHAFCNRPLGVRYLLDSNRLGGLCGDWCNGGSVEGAWQSGSELGHALAQLLD